MMKLAVGLGIAAAAAVLISTSIFLLATAFKIVVPSFILLFETLVNNMAVLPELALNLYLLGPAFAIFGAGVAIGAVALSSAVPFLLIANFAISGMVDSVTLLGAGFSAMGTGIVEASSGISALVTGLQQINDLTDDEGFFAITTDGTKTSMISAKGGVLAGFSSDTLTVDVKVPEIRIPEIKAQIVVNIGNDELRNYIEDIVDKG